MVKTARLRLSAATAASTNGDPVLPARPLAVGSGSPGPAIVCRPIRRRVVPADATLTADASGNLILRLEG